MHSSTSKSACLPNDPIFTRLLQLAHDIPGIRIHDEYGIEAGYKNLLWDILHTRDLLRQTLPNGWFDERAILKPEMTFIGTITYSGYYAFISFFAILSLGGICVPLSTIVPDESCRALDMLSCTNAAYILTEPNTSEVVSSILSQIEQTIPLHIIPMTRASTLTKSYYTLPLQVESTLTFSHGDTCLVIGTSGTTSRSKAAAIPRRRFYADIDLPQDHSSVYLACRPMFWIGGIRRAIIQVLRGGKVYSLQDSRRSPADIWECLKDHRITNLNMSAMGFSQLRDHYVDVIQHLPEEEQRQYVDGARNLRDMVCGGSMLSESTACFWRDITNVSIKAHYASTELGGSATSTECTATYIHGCIGRPLPGVVLRLSQGTFGEILVKSPGMFTRYVGNETATNDAFDEAGFYKTGDLGRLIDKQYFFEGRANADYIRHRAGQISIAELEKHLLALTYISEAYILPVLDYHEKAFPAALVRLSMPVQESRDIRSVDVNVNVQMLRRDLALSLQRYKLPRLLRVLRPGEEVPQTVSQKVLRKEALKQFFGFEDYMPLDYCVEGVEFWAGDYKDL
ncbi:hypothetical protein VTL71DRAFT_3201 [Oculimacula yallundae]|uniref:AMP-dependent synthetase/ligase domain-containing protein n=1 Tax=Oculimacula yallundae TaxID=86028 RepID=A0ABR4C6I3_9HELO